MAAIHARRRAISAALAADALHPAWEAVRAAIEATTPLSAAQKTAGNRRILDMHGLANPAYTTADVWSRTPGWYGVLGGTAAAHAIDWRNPASLATRLVYVGSPIHDASGIRFNGTNQYARTGIVPSALFSSGSGAGLSYYSGSDSSQGDVYEFGSYNEELRCLTLSVKNGKLDMANPRIFAGAYNLVTSAFNNDARGHFALQREATGGSGDALVYRHGVLLTARAATTDTRVPPTVELFLGALNVNGTPYGHSNRTCAAAGVKLPLTDAEQMAEHRSVQAYQAALGRAV